MKRWRAAHPEKEERIRTGRKLKAEAAVPQIQDIGEHKNRCGFCRKRTPIGVIARLKISEETESGYEEIQVLYCGVC